MGVAPLGTRAVLFDRRVVVAVDALQVSDLRVTFKVKKTLRKEPNTAEIRITNLSESSRASMRKQGARVVLLAGYADTVAQIFAGDARLIDHRKDPVEWTTVIQCGDGERTYALTRFSKSYVAGTSARKVISDVVAALRLDPGNLDAVAARVTDSFLTGHSVQGNAATELERLLSARGLTWSIQDGRLQVLAARETTQTLTVLSPATGLVGSPEFVSPDASAEGASTTSPYLKLKSLLQPQIKPGGKIRVESANVRGALYRAESVTHTGDTAGGEWHTEIDAVPVSS